MCSTIAIGDIHGNRIALDDLLLQLQPELGRGDTVVFLGDYIDRGPDTKGCIASILDFRAKTPATVVALMGNHEDWLLRTLDDRRRHSWLLGMEAFPTIASYSIEAAEQLKRAAEAAGPKLITESVPLPYDKFFRTVPEEHLRFLQELRLYHKESGALFVHGGLDPTVDGIEKQPRQRLLWGTADFCATYQGPETVVYGHWNDARVEEGWPRPVVGRWTIGIDTISHGVLTAYRLADRRVFQSKRVAI